MTTENLYSEIEQHLSPKMTFADYGEDNVVFTFGYGNIPQTDLERILNVSRVHGLQVKAASRVSGESSVIDITVYLPE